MSSQPAASPETFQSAYTGRLRCPRCQLEKPDTEDPYGPCPACVDEGVHVNPFAVYNLEGSTAERQQKRPGIFAWQHLLPFPAEVEPVSLCEGGTPLLPLARLGRELGLDGLYLKDESRNPTWSYKDRLIASAVTRARYDGATTVAVASTGNHGAAAAAYAAAAGLQCVALTLASVPLTMKTLMQSYGAQVVALEQSRDRWTLLRAGVQERGWVPLSGYLEPPAGTNPFGIDGYKSLAYEIVEQLGAAPDVVVVPSCYGDGLTGIHRGFTDLVALGVISQVPRLLASEPFGPYQQALAEGFTPGRTVPTGPTVAFSIAAPMATFQGYEALRSSNGAAAVAEESELVPTQLKLAATEGIYLEAASVTSIAILGKCLADGIIEPGQKVVVIGTSTGLKDVETTAAALAPVPVIEPTLAGFDGV